MFNVAEEYLGVYLIKTNHGVICESTVQYGEFLDLCKRYGEENIFEEDKAPEEIVTAYELECLMPYINNLPETTGMKLGYSMVDKKVTLRLLNSSQVVQTALNCGGSKKVAAMIIDQFYDRKKAGIMKKIPFGSVVVPTLRKLLTATKA